MPGNMQLTRIFLLTSSKAKTFVALFIAPFEAAYAATPVRPIIDVIDDGRVLIPTQEELKALLAKSKTVNFMYNGQVFATQTVTKGSTATVPALMPASSGSWDWYFSKPIEEDTDIEWK